MSECDVCGHALVERPVDMELPRICKQCDREAGEFPRESLPSAEEGNISRAILPRAGGADE